MPAIGISFCNSSTIIELYIVTPLCQGHYAGYFLLFVRDEILLMHLHFHYYMRRMIVLSPKFPK